MLWYPLEAPHRGASNEYPQHVFLEIRKMLCGYSLLSGVMSYMYLSQNLNILLSVDVAKKKKKKKKLLDE